LLDINTPPIPKKPAPQDSERRKNPYLRKKHDEVAAALATAEEDKLRVLLENLRAADLAEMIQRFTSTDQVRVLNCLDLRRGALVLKRTHPAVAADVVALLPLERAAELLDWMAVADRASILEITAPELREKLLADMEKRAADEVRQALAWPEQSAGRLIQTHAVRLCEGLTVAQALDQMRALDSKVEKLNDGYILNDRGVLLGVVSLRQLICAAPDRQLSEIMATDIVSVLPTDDQELVAESLSKYDFLSLPVVSPEGVFLGIVTIDDVLDILYEEHSEDLLNMGGIDGKPIAQETYFTASIRQVVRSRVGWLFMLFVAETATGTVLRHFESQLEKVVALSFFIPLMIGTGGNAGSQTVSTIIRGLALGEVRTDDWLRCMRRETTTGVMLGVILGVVAFGRALLWGVKVQVAFAVSCSIFAICTWANCVGALIPLTAHRLGIDPTVVSAPLITTLVDATGLFIYLKVASAVLGL